MAKVFIFCGHSSYGSALGLYEIFSASGINVELVDESVTLDPDQLLKVGRDQSINADVFVVVHSREFESHMPGSAELIQVIDRSLEIGTGLFVEAQPFAIFDRWEKVVYDLNPISSETRMSEIRRLIATIKFM